MQTSAKGVAALEQEEGVVLKAYRCPAGVWTIGAGVTAASGVIKPRAGMVITREFATKLTQTALAEKFEPGVARAMGVAKQHEFDAGVSFHWNTGAIGKASWVRAWRKRLGDQQIIRLMLAWTKGGGKVLPGLTARRTREAAMLLHGIYAVTSAKMERPSLYARVTLPLTGPETLALREGLRALGYEPGSNPNAVEAAAARKFQADHNLTVDGIIGRATLSTLQRALDARRKTKTSAATAAVAAPAASTGMMDQIAGLPGAELFVYGALAVWGGALAYRYRDVIAAEIARPLPRLAAILRSF